MRHKKVKKREIAGDKIYGSPVVAKFINRLMRDGKRDVAEKAFYRAFEIVAAAEKDPMDVFEKAISNISPKQEVKARRVGGASYQIPMEVRGERRLSLAVRWLIEAARGRSNKEYHTFAEKLAAELQDASQNLGTAVKKRDTMQRQAEANRAFAHFRW